MGAAQARPDHCWSSLEEEVWGRQGRVTAARSNRELRWPNDLTLSSEPGKEPQAQVGLVGPPWQDRYNPSLASHSQGVSGDQRASLQAP